ncbi:MAG: BMP family ABC transporter substrate-binding protein [Oscillospiraceae bacterium]|nr:BMP family ABC transporter substrate-binding protein [Oscillospiraceae bacterium]
MKKFLAILLALTMVLALAACGAKTETPAVDPSNPDTIPDNMTASDGVYELAFVTDVGQLKDKSFNQGTWNGVKGDAYQNSKSYKYYQPANGDQATDDDRVDAMKAACDAGAKVVVCAGFMQAGALEQIATANPDTMFVFVDGWPMGLKNVAPIAFKEEQSGYFAGYAVVMEGYTKLGFCGGGGGTNPACCRYGYGFVQGAEAAAAAKGVDVEINYSWQYGASFSASPELQTMCNGWYENGTEIIFACGGSMFASVTAAAGENNGKVVGVDVDQSFESDTVVTSALKDLSGATKWAIDKYYAGEWDDIGDVPNNLGVETNAVGIPTETWQFKNYTVEEYQQAYQDVLDGKLVIDNTVLEGDAIASQPFEHVTINYV